MSVQQVTGMGVVVVANAIRTQAKSAVSALRRRAAELGLPPPHVEWTTPERDGGHQAARAVAAGAALVVACGGDGTVRRVAAAVAGTPCQMGILPAGRADVVAHNLGITDRSLDAVLLGDATPVDLGYVDYRVNGAQQYQECFVTMAGLGWDAEAIRGMTGKGGSVRYFAAGARFLRAHGFPAEVNTVDAQLSGRVWSVFIGNLPSVPPGIGLFPGAGPHSGALVAAVVRPGHLLDWVRIAAGRLCAGPSRRSYAYRTSRVVEVRLHQPRPLHLDGDVISDVVWLRAEIRPAAILVRGVTGWR